MAVRVLEKARPADSAAAAMRRAQLQILQVVRKRGRTARISRAATTAWCAEIGLAFTFHRLSSACDKRVEPGADRELARLSDHQLRIDQRMLGIEVRARERVLLAGRVSHTVAQEVTSLPVPAVVGTAMIGVADSASAPAPVFR